MFKVALIKLNYARYTINKERAIEKKVILTMYETLKVKQLQCLRLLLEKKNVLGNLPTGFGKSLIFDLLPYLSCNLTPSIAIIISSLNVIIDEMVERHGMNVYRVTSDAVHDSQFIQCNFLYMVGQPEQILCKDTCDIMRSWHTNVDWIVVDEAHLIMDWGSEFRPDYQRLGKLRAIFPNAVVLALTATATKPMIEVIKLSYGIDASNYNVVNVGCFTVTFC